MNSVTIIDRQEVKLSAHLKKAAARMYSKKIVEEVILEKITYLSDNLKIKGYIAQPRDNGCYPVLLWNRGGSGNRGALDDLRATLILSSTANWGYVLLATQYRGNRGGEGKEDWGYKDVNDSLNLIKIASKLEKADLSKIGIEGASRGGMTTYRAIAEYKKFKCGIIHAGVTDIFELEKTAGVSLKKFIDYQFKNLSLDEKEREFSKRSALYFADQLQKDCPLLLMHGDNDDQVPILQSEKMVEELKKQNIPYRYEVISGGGHVALKDGSYKIIDILRREWLEKHLK